MQVMGPLTAIYYIPHGAHVRRLISILSIINGLARIQAINISSTPSIYGYDTYIGMGHIIVGVLALITSFWNLRRLQIGRFFATLLSGGWFTLSAVISTNSVSSITAFVFGLCMMVEAGSYNEC